MAGRVQPTAVAAVVAASAFPARLGARLAHTLPVATLRRLFGAVVGLIGLRVLADRSPRLDTGPAGTEFHGHKLEMDGHTLPLAGRRRGSFGRPAYRLSLLALVGDGQSEALAGPVAELARVRLALTCPMRAA